MPLRKRGEPTQAEYHEMPAVNLRDVDTGMYADLERIDAEDYAVPDEVSRGSVDSESNIVVPDNALLYQADGSIVHHRFKITPTGLELPPDLTGEEWAGIGRVIKTIESAGMWAAGDWAAHANEVWKLTYAEIAMQFDYQPETLEVYASVARNVQRLYRNPRLSFSHHRVVAKLHQNKQPAALAKAFDEHGNPLSLAQFKAVLRGKPALPPPAPKTTMGKFNARLTRFSEQQLTLAQRAKPSERRQMADMLRHFADMIEAQGNE